jgi:hypothetical protein
MALHPQFPRSPYEILDPAQRWFPAAEELRSTAYETLLPPLVANVREGSKPGVTSNMQAHRQPHVHSSRGGSKRTT